MSEVPPSSRFPPTRWSLVRGANEDRDGETGSNGTARAALAELCSIYWPPLYSYVRLTGRSAEDAEDLTQGFLTYVLEKDLFRKASEGRGKLRSFLLMLLKRYMVDEYRRAHAEKRGRGVVHFSIDAEAAEGRFEREPSHHETPERHFDRQWALTLLERLMENLRHEYAAAGKHALFDALSGALVGGQVADSYEAVGAKLGLSVPAVKMAVHRMRQRYRTLLITQVADTLDEPSPDEVELEIRYLCDLFG